MKTDKKSGVSGAGRYAATAVQTGVDFATPHRLIEMLLDGALARIAAAKGNMERGQVEQKGANISWTISIIDGLRSGLDLANGGEIAENLNALYSYIMRRLLQANLSNSVAMLDEITHLLSEIRAGWIGVRKLVDQPAGDPDKSFKVVG